MAFGVRSAIPNLSATPAKHGRMHDIACNIAIIEATTPIYRPVPFSTVSPPVRFSVPALVTVPPLTVVPDTVAVASASNLRVPPQHRHQCWTDGSGRISPSVSKETLRNGLYSHLPGSKEYQHRTFPKGWPADREQCAAIIGEWLQTEARYLA
jgi:hypothetical protein